MEGLGRLFNVIMPADDVYISLQDCSAVTFVVFEVDGATSATITFGTTAAGGTTSTPDVVDHYYERSSDVSDGVWTLVEQTASETFTPTDGDGDQAAVCIDATMAPDGAKYVKCNADGGTVTAILHDLTIQRDPTNLASPIV